MPGVVSGRDLWRQYGETVLKEWIVQNPGTRPSGWWHWEAPEPRQRLGGIGLSLGKQMRLGVPLAWATPEKFQMEGRYMTPAPEPVINPHDPPMFESQAAYLRRHGLLSPGEARRLKSVDFMPESIGEILLYLDV